MTQEMDNLTQKMNEMRAEIKTYSDLEAVEQSALQEKQHLSGRKNTLQSNSTALQQLVESRRKILDVKRNAAASDASKALETQEVRITAYHSLIELLLSHLLNLLLCQTKMRALEDNLFLMRETVAQKSAETNIEPIRNECTTLSTSIHQMLAESLKGA